MTADSDNQPRLPDSSGHEPPWHQATTDVLAIVANGEVDALLRRPIRNDRALRAFAGRQEVADRTLHHRWLASETARAAGASGAQIVNILGQAPRLAGREYETILGRQKQLRLGAQERHDPSPPIVPGI